MKKIRSYVGLASLFLLITVGSSNAEDIQLPVSSSGQRMTQNQDITSVQIVACTGNEFQDWFYVTRIFDNQKLGSFDERLSLATCQQIINASGSELVCTGKELFDWFYLTHISDGKQFEERYSLETCLRLSTSSTEIACTGNEFQDWFYVTRIADNQKFGSFDEKLSFAICQQIINASGSELVCTGKELFDWFYLTRISDGKQFKEQYSLETCLQLTSNL